MKKLAIANFKGGVGKTTVAVNLAVVLSQQLKRRVLLVDTDPSANVTAQLRIHSKHALFHLVMEEAGLDDVLLPVERFPNLTLLPSSRATQAAEMQIATQVGRERVLERHLKKLSGYDYVIFDTPPSVTIMAQNAFVCAGSILIPVSMDPMSLLGASTTINLLEEVKVGLDIDCSVLGVIPTFVDSRLVITRIVMEAMQRRFDGLRVFPTVRTDTNVRKATASQEPVVTFARKTRAALDFVELAKEVDSVR